MINQLLPQCIDNTYRGHKLALWLFALVVFVKALQSLLAISSNAIKQAGMVVLYLRTNESYGFISKSAKGASKDYGVKSVSLLAEKK
jgi:hypothetical protein